MEFYDHPGAMEPLFPEDVPSELNNLAIKLIEVSASLSSSVHPITREAIADFLRPMNSYYSNLIEGHDTHPIDIEKALKGDFSDNKIKEDYQKEAHAHIEVHKYICNLYKRDRESFLPTSADFLRLIHKEFYDYLPDGFRFVVSKEGEKKEVRPGEYREGEVEVGRHVAPTYKCLEDFMKRFETFYSPLENANKSKTRRIISIAASHHRLAWIHPFLDGNGRVTRLFSDACFMHENLDGGGLWSISRGLARNNDRYKENLAHADRKRQGDYDGRGNLSNKALIEFCVFFLEVAIDQVNYMTSILETDKIVKRLEAFTELLVIKKGIKTESKYILVDLFLKGTITKADVMRITGTSDKTAKSITDHLESLGLLETISEKGKKVFYKPKYPINYSPSIFPGLYPSSKETDLLNNT